MTAKHVLSDDQFPRYYHGTDAELDVGDLILSGKEMGSIAHGSAADAHLVHIADERDQARLYGQNVYEVEPEEITDTKTRGYYTTSKARVLRQH